MVTGEQNTDNTGQGHGGPRTKERDADAALRELRARARAEPIEGTRRRRRRRRGLTRFHIAAVLLVLAGVLAVRALVGGPASAPGEPVAASERIDWIAVIGSLDERRVDAWRVGDLEALDAVHLPGTPLERADRATGEQLLERGLRPRGLRLDVRSVTVRQADERRANLVVVDSRPAYELVTADGTVAQTVPARAAAQWEVDLADDGTGWRYVDARQLDAEPAGAEPAGR
jgi:hypothetical protein